MRKGVQIVLQFGRQGTNQVYALCADGVIKHQAMGMQKHALQPLHTQLLIEYKITIFVVTQNRKPQVSQVYANLVRASGLDLGVKQGRR